MTTGDGAELVVECHGDGPSLLLVHGAASTRRSWEHVVALLQSRFRTYAMDRRGRAGSSDGPSCALAREAEDIAAVVQRLSPPVSVVGHSYGAICALEALLLTDRISRLVLYEPPVSVPGGLERISAAPICAAVAEGDNESAMVTFLEANVQLPARAIAALRADPTWPGRVAMAPSVCREASTVFTYDLQPARFAQTSARTRVLLGERSSQLMAASGQGVALALRGDVRVLVGEGHVAMQTAPELLAQAIVEALA